MSETRRVREGPATGGPNRNKQDLPNRVSRSRLTDIVRIRALTSPLVFCFHALLPYADFAVFLNPHRALTPR